MKHLHTQHHIYNREAHITTAKYILRHIYRRSTHRHYNVYRSYINTNSNKRSGLIIYLLFCHRLLQGVQQKVRINLHLPQDETYGIY